MTQIEKLYNIYMNDPYTTLTSYQIKDMFNLHNGVRNGDTQVKHLISQLRKGFISTKKCKIIRQKINVVSMSYIIKDTNGNIIFDINNKPITERRYGIASSKTSTLLQDEEVLKRNRKNIASMAINIHKPLMNVSTKKIKNLPLSQRKRHAAFIGEEQKLLVESIAMGNSDFE